MVVCTFVALSWRTLLTIFLVVKLFNAVQQTHTAAAAAEEEAKAGRGSGKPTLAAPSFEKRGKLKGKNKDNIIGRDKERMSVTVPCVPVS